MDTHKHDTHKHDTMYVNNSVETISQPSITNRTLRIIMPMGWAKSGWWSQLEIVPQSQHFAHNIYASVCACVSVGNNKHNRKKNNISRASDI